MSRRFPPVLTHGFAFAAIAAACLSATAQTTPPANPNEPVQPQPALSGASSGSASALSALTTQSPYYIGAQQAFTNQRIKVGSNASQNDWISTTTLRAGVNQPISRQRFFADAEVRINRFSNTSSSNNVGYGLNAGVDWATINRLSGTLSAHADRNRTSYIDSFGSGVPLDNIERSEELRGVGRLGVTTPLTLELGANYRQVDYSKLGADYKRKGAHVAGIYRLSSATNVGLGLAGARTDYADDQSDRRDIYVQGQWIPSSLTDVQARIGRTKVDYDIRKSQSFSGITGSLAWNYRPTARIAVTTTLARDTGQDIGYLRLSPGTPISAANFSVASNSLGVRATYEATAKILVDGGIGWTRNYIANRFDSPFSGTSTATRVSLGARWLATRNASLGCQISHEQQSNASNQAPVPNVTTDLIGCFGSFTLY